MRGLVAEMARSHGRVTGTSMRGVMNVMLITGRSREGTRDVLGAGEKQVSRDQTDCQAQWRRWEVGCGRNLIDAGYPWQSVPLTSHLPHPFSTFSALQLCQPLPGFPHVRLQVRIRVLPEVDEP